MFEKEFIPDDHDLYRRVRKVCFNEKRNKFSHTAFLLREGEDGLSVNWAKYSTPGNTAVDPITRKHFCVGGIFAKFPRQEQLDVLHMPIETNQAHSLIVGARLTESSLETAEALATNCRPLLIV